MKRSWIVMTSAIFLAVVSACAYSEPLPNIVMIISDDHGVDTGAYGNNDVRTPHMDELASEGMRFDAAFASDSLCSPSRAVIHTGLMPFRNGGHVFGGDVREGVKTLSHYLRPLGYQTVLLGKESLHPHSAFPYDVKRTKWNPGRTKEKTSLPKMVNQFLEDRDSEKPLYLEIGTSNPHMPWIENRHYETSKLTIPDHWPETPETRNALAEYYTTVTVLDRTIGNIRKVLTDHGLEENTLLIYTSDHGSFLKWTLYDEGIQVPLLVRWPDQVDAGSSTDALVSLADLLPTIIEAAGGDPPEKLDGRSFLDVLIGEKKRHRKYIFASHTGMGRNYPDWKANHSPHRAIRTKRYKYILNLNPNEKFITHLSEAGPNRQPNATHPYWRSWEELAASGNEKARRIITRYHWRPIEELYDLKKDPQEQNNLASDPSYADVLRKLRRRLGTWRAEQGDNVPVHINEEYQAPKR